MRPGFALASVVAIVVGAGCGSGGGAPVGMSPAADDGGAGASSGGAGARRGGSGGLLTGSDVPDGAPVAQPDGGGAEASREAGPAPDAPPAPADMAPAREAGVEAAARDTAPPPPPDAAPDTAPTGETCGTGGICAGLEKDYSDAFARAVACNAKAVDSQCQDLRPRSLGCGCSTWVNNINEVDPIRKKWLDLGCDKCPHACPAILCLKPSQGACSPTTLMCVNQGGPIP